MTLCRISLLLSLSALTGCAGAGAPESAPQQVWSERVGAQGERAVLRVISESGGVGSGFLIHPSGLAVTNAHVVGSSLGGHAEVAGGIYPFEVVAAGHSRDLALLQLQAGDALPFLRLGESADLNLGAPVLAVGAPQGMFPVVTTGVFGGRSVPGMIGEILVPEQLIHGAPTLRGSSGCPILDVDGHVVGVQSAKPGQELVMAAGPEDEEGRLFDRDLGRWRFQTEAFGLAVPVEDLVHVLPGWVAPEWRTGLETGFSCGDRDGRVCVVDVAAGSPAEHAGLEVGDLVLSVNGVRVLSLVDLSLWLSRSGGLSLDVERGSGRRMISFSRREWGVPAWEDLTPGCLWAGKSGRFFRFPNLAPGALKEGGVVSNVKLPDERVGRDEFYLELMAWVRVPSAGRWVFELSSDDGSQLFVRDLLVVDSDGLHGSTPTTGTIDLEAGLYPLRVTYFEAGGLESLSARWGLEGEALVEIPADQFRHAPGAGW
ncbi:MAG: hypothetical protein CL933_19115 [Deltaproteobacteria bacterium]|nr:hypothetical protein [Deltaproteobacteria bacterium]